MIPDEYKTSLDAGAWKGYYPDTSSVFKELRRLEQYRYVLVLKEYNRLLPKVINGDGYASGYSLVRGTIVSLKTGEVEKSFKLIAGNSKKVGTYRYMRSSDISTEEWRRTLESDLDRSVLTGAQEYVFGGKSQ